MKPAWQGAEAALYEETYLGQPALVKERLPKAYRVPELDERIRRERTKQECVLLHRAKLAGVRTPLVYRVDRGGSRIWLERLESRRLKDVLNARNLQWCRQAGKMIAGLHEGGMVHGDLTTSNFLLHKTGLVLVDFGLGSFSERVEDQAVDLLVFRKTFEATHFDLPRGWKEVLNGYRAGRGKAVAARVLKQMAEVEERARYH